MSIHNNYDKLTISSMVSLELTSIETDAKKDTVTIYLKYILHMCLPRTPQ